MCVCGYEDSQPMIDILDEASKTWGLKSFLNPVRRLNSLSNIGRALLYFFFFFFKRNLRNGISSRRISEFFFLNVGSTLDVKLTWFRHECVIFESETGVGEL